MFNTFVKEVASAYLKQQPGAGAGAPIQSCCHCPLSRSGGSRGWQREVAAYGHLHTGFAGCLCTMASLNCDLLLLMAGTCPSEVGAVHTLDT